MRVTSFRGSLSLSIVLLQAIALQGQSVKSGPAVGQSVPDFSAPDQNRVNQTLHSIMGPKGAMLVFFRSADW